LLLKLYPDCFAEILGKDFARKPVIKTKNSNTKSPTGEFIIKHEKKMPRLNWCSSERITAEQKTFAGYNIKQEPGPNASYEQIILEDKSPSHQIVLCKETTSSRFYSLLCTTEKF
jgi:hypothetical protein